MIFDHVSGTLSDLDRLVISHVQQGGNWRALPDDFPSRRIEQIRRSAAAGGGSRSTYYGRLSWDRPSYTISTFFSRPGNGCFIHPEADRLITIREAARLQSFHDGYRFAGPLRSRFVQVGNAVPPLLAYQLAQMFGSGSFVDLFSGCGGMSLGFEWAGLERIAAVDIDPHGNATLARNDPKAEAPLQLDLGDTGEHRVAMKEIAKRAGKGGVDVLAGGPPCQGFSTAGNCDPHDPRNGLVFAFVAAAKELRPRALLMENVPALMFRRGERVLQEVVAAIGVLGYDVRVAIAHAEGYGVPQLRRRMFLVGSRTGLEWPDPWCELRAPNHLDFQPMATATDRLAGFTVRDAIGDLPAVGTAADADCGVRVTRRAATRYQQWARGQLALDAFVPPASFVATALRASSPPR